MRLGFRLIFGFAKQVDGLTPAIECTTLAPSWRCPTTTHICWLSLKTQIRSAQWTAARVVNTRLIDFDEVPPPAGLMTTGSADRASPGPAARMRRHALSYTAVMSQHQ